MLLVHADKISDKVILPYKEWQELVKLLRTEINVQIVEQKDDKLNKLFGLGQEIWQGIDPVEYQRKERDGF